jgi:geranylgeranyl reductase family protein
LNETDVLIVGGGPAGSSLARALRSAGFDVTVMDRATFPRDKICAGWVTPGVLQSLGLDLDDYARERVLQPIHGFKVGVIEGAEVVTRREDRPISYGIRRCEFDHYLLTRSAAELRLGEPLREMRRKQDRWQVNGDLRARLVVGAGGHFCPVARRLGARPGRTERAVLAQEVEFEMTPRQREACGVAPTVPELYFCRDLLGYGWAFRKGNWLNIGLGREDPDRLTAHVEEFRDALVSAGRIPEDTPRKLRGHAYLLRGHAIRRIHGDGVLLIGDAAGLAYPESGEGIRPAVESGLIAAQAIVEAQGDYGAGSWGRYERRLRRRFGSRRVGMAINDLLPSGLKRTLAHRLLATESFVRRVVLDRWFLHRNQPALPR